MMGPETYDNLGNETYLTQNRIPKNIIDEHIGDSNISDNGLVVSINSNTEITGSLTATTITGIGTPSTFSASLVTINNTQNSRLTALESVTSSYETKGRGIVSGSSQLTSSYDQRYALSGSIGGGGVSSYNDLTNIPKYAGSGQTEAAAATKEFNQRLNYLEG